MTTASVDDPKSLGIGAEELEALRARVRREVDAGLLPSCQYALARGGRLAAFETFGRASPGTRYAIFSATKALVASGAWLLIGDGELEPDRRVAEYLPEFATNGKDVVTVEQLMLHTSGFPRAPLGPPDWADRDNRLAAFGRWRLNWEPGTASEYHPTSAHWVLAELIERLSGHDYRSFLHDRVTGPLGLPKVLGVAPDDQDDVAEIASCGDPPDPGELEALLGVRELPVTEVTEDAILMFNRPEVRAVGVPGGGGIATAATMALFYQALLHDAGGLWDRDVLADGTGRVRNSFTDRLLSVPANRSLGLVLAGDDGLAGRRGFGHGQSPQTFGHNGAGGQIAWADPDSGLSFCYLTNGHDRDPIREGRRTIGISSRAAACAG